MITLERPTSNPPASANENRRFRRKWHVIQGGLTLRSTDAVNAAYPSDSSLNVSKTYDQSGHGYGIGRLTSVTDQAGSDSFTYDKRGNITAESRAIAGVGTLGTSTAFDANSNISSIAYPSGTVAAYTRDSMGNVTEIDATPPGGSLANIANSITYFPFGPEKKLTFGNGIKGTYQYANDYKASTREDYASGTGDFLNLGYGYYGNSSLNTITDSVNAANSQTFTYDGMDRLSSAASASGGYGSYAWTWDAVNNVTSQTINSVATAIAQNSGTNQLASLAVSGGSTTTVDTTSNGNIADFKIAGTTITSFTYNQANQMASATGPLGSSATYEYGFDGQRLLKTPSSGYPIAYQYGQAAKELLAENDLHSGQAADYIYMDPGRNARPIGQVDPTSGNVYYTHTDRQGTPQLLTDASQNIVWSAAYNPFGDTSSFSGTLTTQSLRLPGQYFDPETGNNHNGFRDYAGTLTRYIQSDPIGLRGGMNTYQYVKGNPFKYTDRLGLDPGSPACQEGSVMCGSGPGPGPIWHFLNPDDPDPSGPGGDPNPCTVGSVLCNSGPGGGPGGNNPNYCFLNPDAPSCQNGGDNPDGGPAPNSPNGGGGPGGYWNSLSPSTQAMINCNVGETALCSGVVGATPGWWWKILTYALCRGYTYEVCKSAVNPPTPKSEPKP